MVGVARGVEDPSKGGAPASDVQLPIPGVYLGPGT